MRAEGAGWSRELELAATTLEVLHIHLRAFLMAHGVKNPPPELRVPRPTDQAGEDLEPEPTSLAQVRRAILGGGALG